jgi:hypothetical protein
MCMLNHTWASASSATLRFEQAAMPSAQILARIALA